MSDGQFPEPRPATKEKMWEHPEDPELRVPLKTVIAIVLIEMGLTDYDRIGEACGLSSEEVASIDSADDPDIFRLCIVGVPASESFRLPRSVQCPRCNSSISVAPCMTCSR